MKLSMFNTQWIQSIGICEKEFWFRFRYCFLHEVEHYDFSEEVDRVVGLLTDDENAILMNMMDKCEELEFSKDPDFDACDYAFELEKCWKKNDPEVKSRFGFHIHIKKKLFFQSIRIYSFVSFRITALLRSLRWLRLKNFKAFSHYIDSEGKHQKKMKDWMISDSNYVIIVHYSWNAPRFKGVLSIKKWFECVQWIVVCLFYSLNLWYFVSIHSD